MTEANGHLRSDLRAVVVDSSKAEAHLEAME